MSLTDSSSALGWLHHSTFNPVQNPLHDEVARRFATSLLSHNSSLFAQHIPKKKENGIADSLSRDFHLPTQALTYHLLTTFKSQVPSDFAIYQLENKTTSWIESILRRSTPTTASRNQQGKNRLGILKDGRPSSRDAQSTTRSSPPSHHRNKAKSSVRSRTKLEIIALAERLCVPFGATQLTPPSPIWRRPSENTTSPIPPPTVSANGSSLFSANYEDTGTQIPPPNANAVSHYQSSTEY